MTGKIRVEETHFPQLVDVWAIVIFIAQQIRDPKRSVDEWSISNAYSRAGEAIKIRNNMLAEPPDKEG